MVGDEPIHAHAKVGSEESLARVIALELAVIEQPGEEFLGEVLGLLVRGEPSDSHILVDGLPVGRHQGVKGLPAHREVGRWRALDHRPAGGGKLLPPAANLGVALHWPGPIDPPRLPPLAGGR